MQLSRDPQQGARRKGDAAGGRVARPAPVVDEDRRALAGDGVGPVPVGQQDQVVQRVGPAQAFVAEAVRARGPSGCSRGRARSSDHRSAGPIGSAQSGSREPPAGRGGRAGPTNAMHRPRRGRRRPRVCRGGDAAAPDGTGKAAAHETRAPAGDDDVGRRSQQMPRFRGLGGQIGRVLVGLARPSAARARPRRCRGFPSSPSCAGCWSAAAPRESPCWRRIAAPMRKSRSSSSNPRRWLASTVSKP